MGGLRVLCTFLLHYFICLSLSEASEWTNTTEEFRRQAIPSDPLCSKRWKNAYVPYRIDSTEFPLFEEYKIYVKEAADVWGRLTCLKLEDISDKKEKWNEQHVVIQSRAGLACKTDLGMSCGAPGQMMNLGRGCGDTGLAMHEFGHAFGLYHEHARSDRDNYVKIVLDNVIPFDREEFEKQDTENFGVPYDYLSIMHYGKYTYKIAPYHPTVLTLDPLKQYLIGNPPHPSHFDLKLLHIMYKCSAHCTNPPVCKNEGFVDKNCNCACPHNTKGKFCEEVIGDYYPSVYDQCGEQHIQSDTTITTYKFPDIHKYQMKCQWYLHAPPGKKATITFQQFNLYRHKKCKVDYLRVMQDLYTPKDIYCGDDLVGKTITAENNSLMLLWRTGFLGARSGFSATVKFIDDGSK